MHQFVLRGTLTGHTDSVTAIATPADDTIVTSSRDKSVIVWSLTKEDTTTWSGVPRQRLTGHSDAVHDVAVSACGKFAVSGSSDKELRLWDLNTGSTRCRFEGHAGEVLSVAFSPDNRQIMSGSSDGAIKLWNTAGECKKTVENAHAEPVSCIRFIPTAGALPASAVSGSWDGLVKLWTNLRSSKCVSETISCQRWHLFAVAVSADGSMTASGGDDGSVMVMAWPGMVAATWDIGSVVHALCFCPAGREWLCAATSDGVLIWDLDSETVVAELNVEQSTDENVIWCTSLEWSADGTTLFGGYTDGAVRVWEAIDEWEWPLLPQTQKTPPRFMTLSQVLITILCLIIGWFFFH